MKGLSEADSQFIDDILDLREAGFEVDFDWIDMSHDMIHEVADRVRKRVSEVVVFEDEISLTFDTR